MLTDSAFYGYLNNKEATAEAFEYDDDAHKWLRTGDIGYLDDNDNLFIVDRLKEMIKYKGHQVRIGDRNCPCGRWTATC